MTFIRNLAISGAMALVPAICHAQQDYDVDLSSGNPEVNVKIDTRFDGQINTFAKDADGVRPATEKGFKGSYMLLLINGKINNQFSYNFRYRLYKDNNTPSEFFKATDWLYLRYAPDEKFSVTAGKQPVMIGTMEYDLNPIDVFFASDFWNHVNPWQTGISAGYNISESNSIHLQVTNSIFSTATLDDLFAYNFMWQGRVAPWWQVLNSVNLIEYEKGHYINYVALGNRLSLGNVTLDVDYINRYGGKGTPVFTDFTIMGKADWNICPRVTLFAKGGYDQNKSQSATTPAEAAIDRCVLPGVERVFYGCGVQYFPIVTRRNTVRLHAFWNSSNDKPTMQTFDIGIRWQMDILSLKFKKH